MTERSKRDEYARWRAEQSERKVRKIGELMECGCSNQEIAEKTGIPYGTVGHYAAMFRKQRKSKMQEKEQLMVIQDLVKRGCENKEIARLTGIKLGTVGRLAAVCRRCEREKVKAGPGNNADRHLCMTCKYRSGYPGVYGCDYIGITGHRRGCNSEDCTKYEKGKRRKRRKARSELDGKIGGY